MVFQIAALLIMAVFYGCYFAKAASQRKKGIRTDHMGRGKTGAAKFIELATKTMAICVPVLEILNILSGTAHLPAWSQYPGLVLGTMGAAIFLCAVLTMRDSWRAGVSHGEKTELVTGGIYQFSRNPAFLGFDLVYLGIALMFFSWPLFAASVSAVLLFHLQIVCVEEPFLRNAFGGEYAAYQRRVCRYFGRRYC